MLLDFKFCCTNFTPLQDFKVNTLQNIPKKRFGGRRIQTYLAVLSLILYIFTKISVNLYSGAIFIQQATKINNLYLSIVFLLVMTAICTVVGGLAAVIYTDTLQFFIMIGGSFYVMIKGLYTVGGYSELQTKYLASIPEKLLSNSTCGLPRVDSWRMLRDADTLLVTCLGQVSAWPDTCFHLVLVCRPSELCEAFLYQHKNLTNIIQYKHSSCLLTHGDILPFVSHTWKSTSFSSEPNSAQLGLVVQEL
ncbi:sodium/glucose cotransporter 4-like [Penaeus monodon]|uniref:sodium/glucose cotransporter 4-like n=1 Tax=Penaeus monodon TaxID=6687 RepID=UPI0018A7C636|nr:sodium/glucose cotransporter 4-like [Penaeus monodon]